MSSDETGQSDQESDIHCASDTNSREVSRDQYYVSSDDEKISKKQAAKH